jgi:hypothetical protein
MHHVFVETNWLYAYAAPAHRRQIDAVNLLDQARAGAIQMHLPALCLAEVRRPIQTKCQPRYEADAIRRFLLWAKTERIVSPDYVDLTREVLERFEKRVLSELKQVDATLASLRHTPGLEVFPLNEAMLQQAADLSDLDLALEPFDQAVLAAVLIRSAELRNTGETELSFCEIDTDLQPWNKKGKAKQPLTSLYDAAFVWVYGDFDMRTPERPDDWPER